MFLLITDGRVLEPEEVTEVIACRVDDLGVAGKGGSGRLTLAQSDEQCNDIRKKPCDVGD